MSDNSTSRNQHPETMKHKSGYVALIGKPNAGKSTLMNCILGSKISITTHKEQTTRHQILGIHSTDAMQVIFLDTPGVIDPRYELQKAMMRLVDKARRDADLILFIVDATDADIPGRLFTVFKSIQKPVILIINKMDQVAQEKCSLVSDELNERYRFKETHFISALNGEGVDGLLSAITEMLPIGPAYYPKEMLSEQPVRFFVSELIREQLYLQFHQELPYSCTVEVIEYEERDGLDYINADVIVNRNSQKGMLIGKGGKAIKELGKNSRSAIEAFLGKKIFLDLHVKVRPKWREDANMVRNLGY